MRHTPGPWQWNGFHIVGNGERGWPQIFTAGYGGEIDFYDEADKEFIIRACNSHDDMLEALEALLSVQNGPPLIEYTVAWEHAMNLAGKAIAKAKGEM